MSYKEIFEANNTDLQTILDTVNALPEAGESVETCTVTLVDAMGDDLFYKYFELATLDKSGSPEGTAWIWHGEETRTAEVAKGDVIAVDAKHMREMVPTESEATLSIEGQAYYVASGVVTDVSGSAEGNVRFLLVLGDCTITATA